jgi:hypothetical protein
LLFLPLLQPVAATLTALVRPEAADFNSRTTETA